MKILLGPWPADKPLAELRQTFPQVEIAVAASPADVVTQIVDADAYFGAPNADVMRAARQLRWIQASSAGVEWLQAVPAVIDSDIVVTNTRGAHAGTIGEHVFAMLLTFTRQMRFFDERQKQHTWSRAEGEQRVEGLAGKTMVIVGMGNIGRAIGQRAAAFELRVVGVDAQPVAAPPFVERIYPLDALSEVLRMADVLVLSVPLTPETRGMIGAPQLDLLRPTAYVFAISRGGIVDEEALAEALRAGRLAGAGLDVTLREPLPADSPLWDTERLIITPHVSAHSQRTMNLMWSIVTENIRRFVAGEPLTNMVDKRLGY
jgi:phosphoglycerate dehydrogenase-like enzyme